MGGPDRPSSEHMCARGRSTEVLCRAMALLVSRTALRGGLPRLCNEDQMEQKEKEGHSGSTEHGAVLVSHLKHCYSHAAHHMDPQGALRNWKLKGSPYKHHTHTQADLAANHVIRVLEIVHSK